MFLTNRTEFGDHTIGCRITFFDQELTDFPSEFWHLFLGFRLLLLAFLCHFLFGLEANGGLLAIFPVKDKTTIVTRCRLNVLNQSERGRGGGF